MDTLLFAFPFLSVTASLTRTLSWASHRSHMSHNDLPRKPRSRSDSKLFLLRTFYCNLIQFEDEMDDYIALLNDADLVWLADRHVGDGLYQNAEFADGLNDIDSTAEIAANSPRYRRRSSTFIDGVHDLPDEKSSPMAPAQLYSTMSGRLFHSGRIVIVLVGPPARGKT